MPDITFLSWNVETFGDSWPATRGVAYVPMCNFMANVALAANADIIMLMELRIGGPPFLPTLRAALDLAYNTPNAWQYDYIPGSVISMGPPTTANDLGFTQPGHVEGYALFWNTQVPQKFSMLPTHETLSRHPDANNHHYISLILEGRAATFNNLEGYYNAPDFDPNNPPVWQALDFPIPNPAIIGSAQFRRSRRPCYCVVALNMVGNKPPTDTLLPLLVYHATNNNRSTPWAVQLSAYSQQLYQAYNTNPQNQGLTTVMQALIAGDFNLDLHELGVNNNVDAYLTIVNAFNYGANNDHGGAACKNVWLDNPVIDTAIRLRSGPRGVTGPPINAANPQGFLWLAIDNIFYRNTANSLTPVPPLNKYPGPAFDLLTAVMTNGLLVTTNAQQAVLQSFHQSILTEFNTGAYLYCDPATNTPAQIRTGLAPNYTYKKYIVSNLLDYNLFMADLQQGHLTSARRAAEFIYNCISDHLPVVFRFTV